MTLESKHIVNEDRRLFYPVLNYTKMIGTGLADSIPFCYQLFAVELYGYFESLYASMGYKPNTMIISFLFSQMGNAKDYKIALDKIADMEEVQNYQLVMFYYGRMARLLIFKIQVIEERGALEGADDD